MRYQRPEKDWFCDKKSISGVENEIPLFVCLLLMSVVLRVETASSTVKPVPKPTAPLIVMYGIDQNESLSSKSAVNQLKNPATKLKRNERLLIHIISYEPRLISVAPMVRKGIPL